MGHLLVKLIYLPLKILHHGLKGLQVLVVKQGVVLLEVKEGELGKDCGEELEFAGVALRGGEVVS